MRNKMDTLLLFLFPLFISCGDPAANANRMIIIQPFDNFSPFLTHNIYKEIKAHHSSVVVKQAIPFPKEAYNVPRKRYRADVLIQFLSSFGNADTLVIGLTHKDISTTKGNVQDWGILGLGYCPGSSCVVSTFRLAKKNLNEQFYKVVVHELGHTQGLPHCQEKTCFMRDAEGGNPLNEETCFCASCKSVLEMNGWKFE